MVSTRKGKRSKIDGDGDGDNGSGNGNGNIMMKSITSSYVGGGGTGRNQKSGNFWEKGGYFGVNISSRNKATFLIFEKIIATKK